MVYDGRTPVLHLRTADCAEQQLFDEVDISTLNSLKKKKMKGEGGDGDDQRDDDDDVAESETYLVRSSAVMELSPFLY